ncbi:hypothetical protein TNCV_3558171 [Trichonephila clavipes]|uniref:Uncharacterized protein n=1 Tax=Trichonephila clavipes TaxID=2585209 RepID=A0A8X6WDB6_TRICX|nr:hypothetical protein TNCV_3558171 [Trichonephila clavipes]
MRSGSICTPSSLVIKVTDSLLGCHEFDSSTAEDTPCTGVNHVKSFESSKVIRCCGVVVWREGARSGVVFVS